MAICEIVPKEEEMPRRPKEIARKWIKSKYARKTNRAVQVIHVLGGLSRSQCSRVNCEV